MNTAFEEKARFNMIEQQIRPWDVLDPETLELLENIPREQFVPEGHRELAYADIGIPLAHGQVMMHPIVEARMLQALELNKGDNVLEIGTGSGYVTSMLAAASSHVTSVDINPDFISEAGKRLAEHNIKNVTLECGDASQGWKSDEAFDAIVITGSLPNLPESYAALLNRGGRIFAIIGEAPVMHATLLRRTDDGDLISEQLFETELPALINASKPSAFVF
jgi:protein-L-isoaspartate(D-aspartate) O-methyltransferase